jgi:excisionase family DNA binding protein
MCGCHDHIGLEATQMKTITTTLPPVPDPSMKPTVSVDEAARYLSISRASAYKAAKAGDLPTITVGRRLLVPTAALRRLLSMEAA